MKKKRIFKIIIMLVLLVGLVSISSFLTLKTNASGNTIYFKDPIIEANDSSIIVVEIVGEGTADAPVEAFVRTEGGTAIAGLDYVNTDTHLKMKYGSDGKLSYKFSVKCLNTAENREQMLIYDQDNIIYGRYFNVTMYKANNATIDDSKKTSKCYLPYNYKIEAVTGFIQDAPTYSKEDHSYIKEYFTPQVVFDSGVSRVDGGSRYYTWKHGHSATFNNEKTAYWLKTYIDTGIASAYGSFAIDYVDDTDPVWAPSSGNIIIQYGNKEFLDKFTNDYKKSKDCPGLALYLDEEPAGYDGPFWAPDNDGYQLAPKAMKNILIDNVSPYKKDDNQIDIVDKAIKSEVRTVSWIQQENAFYAGKNALVTTGALKINPYNGIIDTGVMVHNHASEIDRDVDDVYQFLFLVDETAPTIISEFVDDSQIKTTGKLKFYIRFNEPVISTRKNDLTLFFDNNPTPYGAKYLEGNYTDTLVYEMDAEDINRGFREVSYQLPNGDIGDMACNIDEYGIYYNNRIPVEVTNVSRPMASLNGAVGDMYPKLTIDQNGSETPHNIYNLLVSINNDGAKTIKNGKLYYTWDKNENLITLNPSDYASNAEYNAALQAALEDYQNYANEHSFTEEENGSMTITLVKSEKDKIDSGEYYLHLLAVSGYGFTQAETYGKYVLDGEPPEINQTTPSPNNLKEKTFAFTMKNKENSNTKIYNVFIIYKYVDKDGETQELKVKLYSNGEKVSEIASCITEEPSEGEITYKYTSTIDEAATLPREQGIADILAKQGRTNFDVRFEVEDTAGNRKVSNMIRVAYDTRALFNVNTTVPTTDSTDPSKKGYSLIDDINVSYKAYDKSTIGTADEEKYIYFTVLNTDGEPGHTSRDLIVEGTQFYIIINGTTKMVAGENGEGNNYEVRIADLAPGFYEIEPHIKGTASTGEVDLIAENISFYITNNMTDEAVNKKITETNLVLNNKVFQLQDQRYYFLDESGSKVLSHPYGATYDPSFNKSEGGSTYPSFSNVNEAKKYVKFMEYQDLYLIKITANIANLLNGGTASTAYVKANGETTIAQEGQLWIRYKKNIWQNTASANGWAFYYYGTGNVEEGLNLNSLPANINDAINEVVNRITSTGETVYLVTEETLNQRNGAPYLASGQIHASKEEATVGKAGTTFVSSAKYDGDKDIYKNKIKVQTGTNESVEYALVTNMQVIVEPSTRIFYKYANEGDWVELPLEDGKSLSELMPNQATGFYRFREYGSSGISEYDVYYDRETPLVDVEVGNDPQVLDGSILSYSGETFTIKKIKDADDLAYVAIYSYPNKSLINVLYASDLTPKDANAQPFKLQDKNYYVQVGDRSGNNVLYTVLLSQTSLDVQVYENDSNTNIIVKVLDRQENEIYSYEIYLNENLVTTEFEEIKVLRDPGIYRIVVKDIYGNEVNKTIEFASRTPEINWYYLSNDSYIKYDPDKIVNMIIKPDPNSARISNVYTAAMLKLTFVSQVGDDLIKFEMLDIDAKEYSYFDATSTITINSLIGFKLRVWFEGTPENDRTYIVTVDNEPPTVGASFIGTSFNYHTERDNSDKIISTSTFEYLNLDDKNDGDVLTVDNLAFDEASAAETTFTDGAVIRGGHIVLTFTDPSEIGKYTIAKDGQAISVDPDSEGRLILNSYGDYVVTVSDKLGNTRVFRFTNTNDPIAVATIDDVVLKEKEEQFGSGDVLLKLLYQGEARILVKTDTDIKTYIFKYEGSNLTYGFYVCKVEKVDDGSGNINERKTAVYQENPDFKFDLSSESVIENREYDVITTDDYLIKVVKVEGKPVLKFMTIEKEIHLEMSYNAGKTVLPSYYIVSLSKEAPAIRLLRDGVEIEITEGSKYTYISETLTIDPNVNQNIIKIEVAYSKTPNFGKLETIYDGSNFSTFLEGTENGFYKIVVTNKYNNQTEYIIVKVDSFETIVEVTYKDASTREFLTNENPIYSNSLITFNVYSEHASFEIDGEKFEGIYDAGVITLEIFKEGEHKVRIIGGNEVTKDYDIVIGTNQDFTFKEEWLTGYNEEALLRSQAYTNQPLTPVIDDEIKYVSYKYGHNDLVVLYDVMSEEKIDDQNKLINTIGQDGIGDYIVYFTNIYGDTVNKVVHFRNVAQLSLSRKTTNSGNDFEIYLLDKALVDNFYSNNILKFETTSTKYLFTIDGVSISLEGGKILEFGNSSGNGSFEYQINFLDEYGNYVDFKAELYRDDVVIDSSQMKEIEISNSKFTKDDVIITFDDNLNATVSFNDGEKKKYESGTKFYRDGKYEFIVEDIAGNRNTYVINHKSMNHYTLKNVTTDQSIITDGVINDSSVTFSATDDSKIVSVFKNGQKMNDYTSNSFTTTAHWEVIIEDSIGNQSYDSFYIINNALVSFEYTAPYDFEITEVWLIKSKENKELLNLHGQTIKLDKDGDYSVVASNTKSATTMNFSVTIDTTPPTATLNGVEDGGITARNVSIKGLKSGDIVEIYKNGTLMSTTDVSASNTAPEIETGGNYRIVIKSVSGAQIEYNFTRKQIANVATSVFVIITCIAAIAGITIGLLYHTKLKNDSEK